MCVDYESMCHYVYVIVFQDMCVHNAHVVSVLDTVDTNCCACCCMQHCMLHCTKLHYATYGDIRGIWPHLPHVAHAASLCLVARFPMLSLCCVVFNFGDLGPLPLLWSFYVTLVQM